MMVGELDNPALAEDKKVEAREGTSQAGAITIDGNPRLFSSRMTNDMV
jgi:hypothetical protein